MLSNYTKGLVSVIVPIYNDTRFLREALNSIVQQSYKEFEIILVDDYSKNKEQIEIIGNEYKNECKITFKRNERNLGLAATRNVGIRAANGEFICFLDADDVFAPDKLRIQTEILDKNTDIDITFSDEYVIRDNEKVNIPQQFPYGFELDKKKLVNAFAQRSFIAVFTVMLRSSVLKQKMFNEQLKWNEDDDLWFRVFLNGNGIYSDYVSGYRRLHDSNMSRDRLAMSYYQIRTFYEWCKLCKKSKRDDLKQIIKKRGYEMFRNYIRIAINQRKVKPDVIFYYAGIYLS